MRLFAVDLCVILVRMEGVSGAWREVLIDRRALVPLEVLCYRIESR
jgi:hypothetical protein